MIKMLKIVAMLLVITTVVFAAGCAGKTTENKNETRGATLTSENGTEKTLTAEVPTENITKKVSENITENVTGNITEKVTENKVNDIVTKNLQSVDSAIQN